MTRVLVTGLLCALAWPAAAQDGFGGSRNNGLVREQIQHGYVPAPEAFTMEGFLAEHHFPVREERCLEGVLCVFAAMGHGVHRPTLTRSSYLLLEPVSGLDPTTFRRGALNVGIVVDRSGSMTGVKLAMALAAAHALVDRLDARDRVSLVAFDDAAMPILPPMPVIDRAAIHAAIDSIAIGGGTNLHAGLAAGFGEVEQGREPGRADRVFVFTDEQPNIGVVSEGGFLEMVGHYAARGIALSVVGVGLDMGAELASAMTQLEGGAYHYLESADGIGALFGGDFDQHVTPVAYRLAITIKPGAGLSVADVYGVPGDNVIRNPDGSVTLRAGTVFLDRHRSGAIVRLAAEGDAALHAHAEIDYSYLSGQGGHQVLGRTEASHEAVHPEALAEFDAPAHYRAYALVNFAELLHWSLVRYRDGNPQEALRILGNARTALDLDARGTRDPDLARERDLADRLLSAMQPVVVVGPEVAVLY